MVFITALFGFVTVGLLILGLLRWTENATSSTESGFTDVVRAEEKPGTVENVQKKDALLWESIPEQQDSEETMASEEADLCVYGDGGRILQKALPNQEEISLLFAGDILFDDGYAPMGKLRSRQNGILDCFSPETFEIMRSADFFMLNNEFPYTKRGTPTEGKTFTFRAKPENVTMLNEMGVDLVSLANNHAYDYGEVSLLDSMDTLIADGMPFVGAGHNLSEAVQPFYLVNDDLKIAIISGTQIERQDHPNTKGATDTTPGVFRCWNADRIVEEVQKAKAEGYYTICFVHWGTEKTTELDWAQLDLAKKLTDCGADMIIGGHPHVLQGIEIRNQVPIIYSLGNYWFNSASLDTCLVKVTFTKGKLSSWQFIPARQENCYTKVLDGSEKARVISYMRSLSPNVVIDDDGYLDISSIQTAE